MRRGTLIYRGQLQQILARSILARQPLVARLTRHQQLPQALGLPGRPVSQTIPASSAYTSPLPIVGRNFRPAIVAQTEESEEIPAAVPVHEAAMPVQPFIAPVAIAQAHEGVIPVQPLPAVAARQEQPAPIQRSREQGADHELSTLSSNQDSIQSSPDADMPFQHQESKQQDANADVLLEPSVAEADTEIIRESELQAVPEAIRETEPVAERQEDVQPPIRLDATEQIAPLPEDGHASTREAATSWQRTEARQQAATEAADESIPPGPDTKSPIETVRPRRPRRNIEELTAQAGRRSSPSMPATRKETQEPQRNVQASEAHQRPDTRPAGEGEIRADELFLPANTDRSPQAWLARLMGKSLPAQEDESANVASDTVLEKKPLPDIKGKETLVDEGLTIPPSQQGNDQHKELSQTKTEIGVGHVMLSGSEASESGKLPGRVMLSESEASLDPSRAMPIASDASLPLSMTGPENGLPFDEQARSQQAVVGQQSGREDTRQREGQSQPRLVRAINLDTVSGMPGIPGAAGIAEAGKTVQARQAEQLSSRTRRFLRPLVGIDPVSVQIHRDAQAARLADAYHADAVTLGDDVELSAGYAGGMETPETLGLLAHELTHVARQREPGFVPPIAQVQTQSGSTSQGQKPTSTPPVTADEETLALHVERQVKQAAGIVGPPLAGGLGDAILPSPQDAASPSPQDAASPSPAPFTSPEPVESRRLESDRWGGLPAPWEPLPGWLTTPGPSTEMEQSAPGFPAPAPAPPSLPTQGMASNGSNHQSNGHSGAEVQRAARGRSVGEDAVPSASSPAPPSREARAPEPDLDELARQVYSILRNRLEVERRRHR